LVPTSAFINVDLPTFGLPTKQANPDLNPVGALAGACGGVLADACGDVCGDPTL
jgi:hypothetical protein